MKTCNGEITRRATSSPRSDWAEGVAELERVEAEEREEEREELVVARVLLRDHAGLRVRLESTPGMFHRLECDESK